MRRSIVLVLATASAVALLVRPGATSSQSTPLDKAARNLLATSYADAMLNPAQGEDTEFFITRGGLPNVMFVLDTSASMQTLPPNGPTSYTGNGSLPPDDVIGCNLEQRGDVADVLAFQASALVAELSKRKFSTACGRAKSANVFGERYLGHPGQSSLPSPKDYADEAEVCPRYTSTDPLKTGDDGFDPDFYNVNGSDPKFFEPDRVFHDSIGIGKTWSRDETSTTSFAGDGWRYNAVHPFADRDGNTSIDNFCFDRWSGDTGKRDTCRKCLKDAGWYYDGNIVTQTVDGTEYRYPSLWYTGNYLNFFPPKFIVARKVLKDVLTRQSKVRMAVAGLGADGMRLDQNLVFNPSCDHPDSNFDSNRGAYISKINDTNVFAFTSASKKLATALFDVGRFYHSPNLPWFGTAWEKDNQSTGGTATWESSSTANQFAVCYSCQTSTVILLTDGASTADDTSLPTVATPESSPEPDDGVYAGNASTGMNATESCEDCDRFSGSDEYKDNLAKVAWYLHNYDLRNNAERTRDCGLNGGKQTLDLYTVGFNTTNDTAATNVLTAAASAGGGRFVSANDASLLYSRLVDIFAEINDRSTSFSVATVSTLQTSSGHSVIVPRFDPEQAPFWKGHLFRYELYSEFVNECVPGMDRTGLPPCCTAGATDGPLSGDLDCDGTCRSVFLADSGDKFVQEGGDGFFYQNDPNYAACSQAPLCGSTKCGIASSAPAQPWWDAGEGLRQTDWEDRKVFTVVDRDDDGDIDADDADEPVQLSVSNMDAAAAKILPYLGVGRGNVCGAIADKILTGGYGQANASTLALAVRTTPLACAKAVIRYVLGADLFNEARAKTGWPSDPNELPDRPFKLGDVFHSSPVVVDPPPPANGILCPNGLHNQCLNALWKTPTEHAGTSTNAYQDYATSEEYETRRKIILVGANDGLLHAFNGGTWHAGGNDPVTRAIDESQWPFNGYYDRGFDPNATEAEIRAQELWAFLPPDLISKLPLMMTGQHQLYVDGTAMVREVWVDGTENEIADAVAKDDVKQKQEFHTVAIVGERRGGTRYFALDVSDAWRKGSEGDFTFPKFLWMYPQPTSRESLSFGETYTDFLPVAPPIGPVRIKADNGVDAAGPAYPKTKTMSVTGVGDVAYHERWVAMLSGGYDPQYLRGRGVHMVDVWTGREYFDFSYPDASSTLAANDPLRALKFPIPATVGMVTWGSTNTREDLLGFGNDGFFDTATFGDTGGQLWVLRFHRPGELDANGLAQNWSGARIFQMGSTSTSSLRNGHPFFYITANAALPDNYVYRVFAGTGDRFNLLDKYGGQCGPDNLRACVQRGCTVTLDASASSTTAGNWLQAPDAGTYSGALSQAGSASLTTAVSRTTTPSSAVEAKAKIVISSCPSPATNGGATSMTKQVELSCSKDEAGAFTGYWGCMQTENAYGDHLALSESSNVPSMRNWYFSLVVFDANRPVFDSWEGARTYDAARLHLSDDGSTVTASNDIIVIDGTTTPSTLATKDSTGWALYYNHDGTIPTDGHNYEVEKLDERTSSVSAIYRYLTWNTTQPTLSVTAIGDFDAEQACLTSKCTGEQRRIAYHYAANPITGGPVLRDASGNLIRSLKGNTLVPAQGDQPTVFVNQKGQVAVGLTVINPEKGASNVGQTEAVDPIVDVGYLELSEAAHACRHAEAMPNNAVCK